MNFLKEFVKESFRELDDEQLVSIFRKSNNGFRKNIFFDIVLSREFKFEIWWKLYSNELPKDELRADRRSNAFFFKMEKTAKIFTDHECICNCIGVSKNWNSARIDRKSYGALQTLAVDFIQFEIVCKAALLRRDYKTAVLFMHKMYHQSETRTQYLLVEYFYSKLYLLDRDIDFGCLLAKKIEETVT